MYNYVIACVFLVVLPTAELYHLLPPIRTFHIFYHILPPWQAYSAVNNHLLPPAGAVDTAPALSGIIRSVYITVYIAVYIIDELVYQKFPLFPFSRLAAAHSHLLAALQLLFS